MKLSRDVLECYLKKKHEYLALEKRLKDGVTQDLYGLRSISYDTATSSTGSYSDLSDRIIKNEELKDFVDKELRNFEQKIKLSRETVEQYIKVNARALSYTCAWNGCNLALLQNILTLKYLNGKSNTQIAATLKISLPAVTNMLSEYTEKR